MNKQIPTDLIEVELEEAFAEIDEITGNHSREFSNISDMTENLGQQTEELVRGQTLPQKEVIGEVSTTDMVIDLSLANIAKQTSVKLSKMETFLSRIEDRLYDDKTLEKMNKHELMALYTNTRLMRTDAFKMLAEIRRTVDFSALEAQLLSMHSKESMRDDTVGQGDKMKGMLEQMLTNPEFLITAAANQKSKLQEK